MFGPMDLFLIHRAAVFLVIA